jgi:hypothetical chaperone protein
VPSGIYFDLATWHLINTLYAPARMAEARALRVNFADLRLHDRLMTVLTERLGHGLAAQAEAAKIALAEGEAPHAIDLFEIERGLAAVLRPEQARDALAADMQRIVDAADETLARAGVAPNQVDALYLTGGSTGWRPLADRLAARLPKARAMRGDRFASVARGLGLHAKALFGAAA